MMHLKTQWWLSLLSLSMALLVTLVHMSRLSPQATADGRRRWLKSIMASMGCTLSCKPAKTNKGQIFGFMSMCATQQVMLVRSTWKAQVPEAEVQSTPCHPGTSEQQ
jgi:hypothetical protein